MLLVNLIIRNLNNLEFIKIVVDMSWHSLEVCIYHSVLKNS